MSFLGGRGLLEVLEGFECAEEHAVGGFDAALEAVEGFDRVLVGMAEGRIVLDAGVDEIGMGKVLVEAFDLVGPELGLDSAETALGPLGGDQRIDERELGGVGGLVVEEERGGERFERGGVFAANDVVIGVDAGF